MAPSNDNAQVAGQIRSVTYIGMVVNVLLAIVKVVVGLAASSLALVADGVHSVSDLLTDIVVIVGSHLGAREPDQTHPYGHGRLETFSAVAVAAILIVVGGAMIYEATLAIAKNEASQAHWAVMAAAIVSILAKEWIYRVTRKVAVRSHSTALYANAWHHRSDALSSVAVLIGYLALRFGFEHGDQMAAIAVGMMVILVGVKVVGDSLRELTEGAVDSDTAARIEAIIDREEGVRQWHRLRTRTVGREVFLDVHILVDPELNVAAAHDITERLECSIDAQIPRPINLTVHIEPDLPQFRK